MSTKHKGSQIQLVFQVNVPTFTPDQFNQVLKEKGFLMTPGQGINPQGQPMQLQIFSKGDLVIFFAPVPQNPTQFQIVFQALNTVSLMVTPSGGILIEDINDILERLNIVEDVVSLISFNCSTREKADIEPAKSLTAGIKPEVLQRITKALGPGLNVTSLRLGTEIPLKEGMQLILEPLATDPTRHFFVNVIYQTNDMKKFGKFVKEFGEKVIEDIVEAMVNA